MRLKKGEGEGTAPRPCISGKESLRPLDGWGGAGGREGGGDHSHLEV